VVLVTKAIEHDPEKWVPVFPRDKREAFARRSCSNKKIEWDDDSKKSHPALAPRMLHYARSVAQKGLLNAGNPAAIQSFCLWYNSIRCDLCDRGGHRELSSPVRGVFRMALASILGACLALHVACRSFRGTSHSKADVCPDKR